MRRTLRWSMTATAAAGALVAAGLAASPGAHAKPGAANRHTVPNTVASWTTSTPSQGAAPDKATSHFRVYLAPKGGLDAEKAAVTAVSTPGTSSYGHFLTPDQFHAGYDPTAATVSSVSSYLKSAGLKVQSVASHNRYIEAKGSNAAVEKAFHTTIKAFQHNGQSVQANTTPVKVPNTLATQVLTVTGLDTTPHLVTHQSATPAPPPAGFKNARPCSTYYGQIPATTKADYKTPLPKFQGKTIPYAVCGYTGPQYRAAYEGATNLTGGGVTIGVLDAYASPTIAQDAATYANNHGDGGYRSGQLTQVTPSTYTHEDECGPSGWFGEETLDVEAEHAMAPNANIRYYGAQSCYDTDFQAALANVVEQNKVSILSNSWSGIEEGEDASTIAAYEQIFMQGDLQGISFTFSSGDNGDEVANTGLKQVDYPSSDPYVTAIGGTADGIGPDGSMAFQTGWGTQKYSLSADGASWSPLGYLYGAGGGSSSLFNQPSYQRGKVPGAFAGSRAVPDVSMDADPTTGMLIGETQTFSYGVGYGEYRIGGTSLASPLFAGETALLLQRNGGRRTGLLNPLLYGQLNAAATMHDVNGPGPDAGNVRIDFANGEDVSGGLLYSVRTFNQDSSLGGAVTGWDDVTGVGSPNSGYVKAVLPPPAQ